MNVVALHNNGTRTDTILDFVRLEGPVTTLSVASRFGTTTWDARAKLLALADEGKVALEDNMWRFRGDWA